MGKGKNNINFKINVLRNISTQAHLKAKWQMYLKTELPLIRVGVIWEKNGSGHKKRKRMNLKLKRKAKMDPTQNPSLGGQWSKDKLTKTC